MMQLDPIKVQKPVSLMTHCSEVLPYPSDGSAESVVFAYLAAAEMYHECRVEKDGLIEWIKNE